MLKKITSQHIIIALLIGTAGLQVANFIGAHSKPTPKPPTAEKLEKPVQVSLEGLPQKGSDGAKVVMLEVSDFECPYCKRYATETAPQIQKQWVDTGKVRYGFVNMPLPIHKDAKALAQAGICAAREGKFWEYHDQVFKEKPITIPECDSTTTEILAKEDGIAKSLSAKGTPTFALGLIAPDRKSAMITRVIRGAVPVATFDTAIIELTKS